MRRNQYETQRVPSRSVKTGTTECRRSTRQWLGAITRSSRFNMLASRQIGSTSYPIFSKNFRRLEGKDAWRNNLELAALAASKVASCLGPTGAYKLVTYHLGPKLVTKVTKDAADIVDELGVQYPAVKTLAEAAKIHRDEAGDGV